MSLASWMQQTITLASETGRDAYGKPTYGATRTATARVERTRRMVRNGRGEDAIAQWRLYTLEVVALTDRIWLPGTGTAMADSFLPLAVVATSDKPGARTLYRVDIGG